MFFNCQIFSVAKVTQMQMAIQLSVCPSVIKTPQPLRIAPIDHRAYWPSSLLTIKPIDHQTYQPSSLLTIKPIDHLFSIAISIFWKHFSQLGRLHWLNGQWGLFGTGIFWYGGVGVRRLVSSYMKRFNVIPLRKVSWWWLWVGGGIAIIATSSKSRSPRDLK